MTDPHFPPIRRVEAALARCVRVEPHEIAALIAAFIMFFLLLSAYYIVRPVRDEMGVALGKDAFQHLFSIVFVVMLAAVPAFGFVASRFPRRLVLPALYAFFALNLVLFWIAFKANGAGGVTASVFFVWASVFIVRLVEPVNLLLISAALLTGALAASLAFRRSRGARTSDQDQPAGGGLLDGAAKLLQSPYFAHIALFVFLANVVGTFFYLEQARLVAAEVPDSAERVGFFSGRDLIVSAATIVIQIFGTAQVMRRLGLTAALIALPLTAAIGTAALTVAPVLWVVAAAMVAERVVAFSLSNPAMKVMYTLASADEKYKVQNFVDTVVYRGGDAASGWLFAAVSRGAGFAEIATPMVAVPLVAAWIWNASQLGRNYQAKSESDDMSAAIAHARN